MQDLKELAKTLREDLEEVMTTAAKVDEIIRKDPESAVKELNILYCDVLSAPQHNDSQLKTLVKLADELNPVIDEYLDAFEKASTDLNRIKPAMSRLMGLRNDFAKAKQELAKKNKPWGSEMPGYKKQEA